MTGEKGSLLAGLRASPKVAPRHRGSTGRAHGAADAAARRDALPGRSGSSARGTTGTRCPWLSRSWWRASRGGRRTPRGARLLGWALPLGRAWWAKALWCLASAPASNLVIFGIYFAGSAFLLAGPHGRGATLTDAPLRARQHGDRGVDDRRALPHGAARHARGHLLPARRAARGWVRLVAGAAAAALSAVRAWSTPPSPCCREPRGGHGAQRGAHGGRHAHTGGPCGLRLAFAALTAAARPGSRAPRR